MTEWESQAHPCQEQELNLIAVWKILYILAGKTKTLPHFSWNFSGGGNTHYRNMVDGVGLKQMREGEKIGTKETRETPQRDRSVFLPPSSPFLKTERTIGKHSNRNEI